MQRHAAKQPFSAKECCLNTEKHSFFKIACMPWVSSTLQLCTAQKCFLRETLFGIRGLTLRLLQPAIHWRRRRNWHKSFPSADYTSGMAAVPLEGYTDSPYYMPGTCITFFLQAQSDSNIMVIECAAGAYKFSACHTQQFQGQAQPIAETAPEQGLGWNATVVFPIPEDWSAGYYRAKLTHPSIENAFYITFVIGQKAKAHAIAVLAPTGTWIAYNAYGGKSLYKNAVDGQPVYQVSAQRPNTALQYNGCSTQNLHDMHLEAHVYSWLQQRFGADIYPDYYLEKHPELFFNYKMLVPSYHMEYVSEASYNTLRQLVLEQKISLLNLGANQLYWQIRWLDNYSKIECRKDASPYENTEQTGGLWRHTAFPEDRILGASFTEGGMGTYAPYEVVQPRHWLFEGLGLQKGQLFGHTGINALPICGDETDKTTFCSRRGSTVLAKGLNAASAEKGAVYSEGEPEWDGSGGGEIVLTELSATHAVLATGAIQSGSGLGADPVFTQMIVNFVVHYAFSE